jgi:hypothetical protein
VDAQRVAPVAEQAAERVADAAVSGNQQDGGQLYMGCAARRRGVTRRSGVGATVSDPGIRISPAVPYRPPV